MTETLDVLDKLIAFPTVSSETNLPLIDYAQGYLADRGFDVHRIEAGAHGKAGLLARIGPENAPGVMLSAHSDVVPTTGQSWTADPFRMKHSEGNLYGRGATDMKGFLASALALADRVDAGSMTEALKFAISWDEEIGCLGVPQMLPHLATTIGAPRLCIVGEPTSMQVACGHKGKIAFRADCHGVPGHSAMAPHFVNALYLANDLVARIRKIQGHYEASGARDAAYEVPYTTLHVGRMSGGTALNVVPVQASVDFEARFVAGDSAQDLEKSFRAAAGEIASEFREEHPDVVVQLEQTIGYPGFSVAADASVVAEVSGLAESPGTIKVAYGTEAGHFAEAGIATVVCGPGSMEQGHIADEFISSDQLSRCDAFMDRIGRRIGAIA